MFTEGMFAETARLKQEGLRGKKLAKTMCERFSSYSAEELRLFAELVPSPELRSRARPVHSLLLFLLATGCIAAAMTVFSALSQRDFGVRFIVHGGIVALRVLALYSVARYRREGGFLAIYGGLTALPRIIRGASPTGDAMDLVNVAFALALAMVAWLWVEKLFPNLTLRGQLR